MEEFKMNNENETIPSDMVNDFESVNKALRDMRLSFAQMYDEINELKDVIRKISDRFFHPAGD